MQGVPRGVEALRCEGKARRAWQKLFCVRLTCRRDIPMVLFQSRHASFLGLISGGKHLPVRCCDTPCVCFGTCLEPYSFSVVFFKK